MKEITKINDSNEFMEKTQTKWKFLKYDIRKFTIDHSETIAKKGNNRRII